jgi:hypothetical protein
MVSNIYFRLVTQDLYPEHQVDVEVSDEDNTRREEPTDNDAKGVGAPSIETLAPNLIGFILVELTHPSTTNQTATTAPSSGG